MCVALLFAGVSMFLAEVVEDEHMLDGRLEQLGNTLLFFVERDLTDADRRAGEQTLRLKTPDAEGPRYSYQVWSGHGRMLLRSHNTPVALPMMPLDRSGFATARFDDEDYRIFSVRSPDGEIVVQVAECSEEVVGQAATVAAYYVGFLVLPFGLLFTVSALLMRRSLRSVEAIAEQLARRNPLDVTSLEPGHPPKEMQPILDALDGMFRRVRRALTVERRFTSLAAHELKTPLAGVRAQAQLAIGANSLDEARDALRLVNSAVDRSTRMLDQLLDLARIDELNRESAVRMEWIDLDREFQGALQDLSARADAKGIRVTTQFDVASMEAFSFGVRLALHNLLANAIIYCPHGGRLHVSTVSDASDVILRVDDSGPGIPEKDRDLAFERFNRLGKTSDSGVGLGLSIVLMVAGLHRARVELLDSPLGGLRVQMTFVQPAVAAVHESRSRGVWRRASGKSGGAGSGGRVQVGS